MLSSKEIRCSKHSFLLAIVLSGCNFDATSALEPSIAFKWHAAKLPYNSEMIVVLNDGRGPTMVVRSNKLDKTVNISVDRCPSMPGMRSEVNMKLDGVPFAFREQIESRTPYGRGERYCGFSGIVFFSDSSLPSGEFKGFALHVGGAIDGLLTHPI